MPTTNPHTDAPYRAGELGALLDEYQKAQRELSRLIEPLEDARLLKVVDPDTPDPDCHSIQTVLAHVVRSGTCYALDIRKLQGESVDYPLRVFRSNAASFVADLDEMFRLTQQVFLDYPNLQLETNDPQEKILTHWGQHYDVEQWLEHAIVHVLRHRRQIERFLMFLKSHPILFAVLLSAF